MQKRFFLLALLWCPISFEKSYAETIHIGINDSLSSFHPLLEEVTQGELYAKKFLHKPFLDLDKNGALTCSLCKILPTLENGCLEQNKGGQQTATFEIRAEAEWDDGKPITSEDVEFSWKLAIAYALERSEDSSFIYQINSIDKDKKNPKKFKLLFSKSHLAQVLNQFFLVPSHLEKPFWNQSENDFALYMKNSLYTTNPLTKGLYNGDYLLSKIEKNKVTLLKKESKENLEVKFLTLSEEQLVKALQEETIDLIPEGFVQEKILKEMEKNSHYTLAWHKTSILEMVSFNLRNPILRDRRLRKALAYAINKKDLMERSKNAQGIITENFLQPQNPYSIQNSSNISFDLEKAKKILDETGWILGADKKRKKQGKELRLELVIPEDKERGKISEALLSQWKSLGISFEVKKYPPQQFFTKILPRINYTGLALFAWDLPSHMSYLKIFHSDSIPTLQNNYKGLNVFYWTDHTVNRTLLQLEGLLSEDEKRKNLALLQDSFFQEEPFIPLFFRTAPVVFSKKFKDLF